MRACTHAALLADDYKVTPASRVEAGEALLAIAPSGGCCSCPVNTHVAARMQ